MSKQLYKVTNRLGDERKFRDTHYGRDIYLKGGQSVITNSPPEESDVFKVEEYEEKVKKKKYKEDE